MAKSTVAEWGYRFEMDEVTVDHQFIVKGATL